MAFLLEYWIQAATVLFVLVSVWLMARVIRDRAPYLLDALSGAEASVEVGEEGVTLARGGRAATTLPWREVARVRVRATGGGPAAEDLFMDFEGTAGSATLTIPSGAVGFDGLLERVGVHLPGFDMEGVVEATLRMEAFERVVWEEGRGGIGDPGVS